MADYISQYLLDRYIERDPLTKYAVEVQIKGYHVTLGGEVSSRHRFSAQEIAQFVREAVNEIGYTKDYQQIWGAENTICGDMLNVSVYISHQSPDIAQGLDGWGDQGIFFGYYAYKKQVLPINTFGLSLEHALAKRLCHGLFVSGLGGLDIKTQVVTEDDKVVKVIAAIPLLDDEGLVKVENLIRSYRSFSGCEVIVNGTGRYVQHSSVADCGTTGRKLVVDFYGGACRIGGGSPWTKDGSKADLALNLYARDLAKQYAREFECDVFTSIACCIGKQEVEISVCDAGDNILWEGKDTIKPLGIYRRYLLNKPIYASMCRWGLFGEFQQDKPWEL